MVDLENSNKRLIQGISRLLRNEVDGWSTNSEYNVDNVWGKGTPQSVQDEFPRGIVDVVSANDFELSVNLNIRLREATVKIVVFGHGAGKVEELINDSEDEISDKWKNLDSDGNSYIGDWSFKNVDGTTETIETGEQEGELKYNRSIDLVFETIKN